MSQQEDVLVGKAASVYLIGLTSRPSVMKFSHLLETTHFANDKEGLEVFLVQFMDALYVVLELASTQLVPKASLDDLAKQLNLHLVPGKPYQSTQQEEFPVNCRPEACFTLEYLNYDGLTMSPDAIYQEYRELLDLVDDDNGEDDMEMEEASIAPGLFVIIGATNCDSCKAARIILEDADEDYGYHVRFTYLNANVLYGDAKWRDVFSDAKKLQLVPTGWKTVPMIFYLNEDDHDVEFENLDAFSKHVFENYGSITSDNGSFTDTFIGGLKELQETLSDVMTTCSESDNE